MYALRESSSNEDKDTISPDFLDLHKTRFTFLKGFQELKKLMGGGGGCQTGHLVKSKIFTNCSDGGKPEIGRRLQKLNHRNQEFETWGFWIGADLATRVSH